MSDDVFIKKWSIIINKGYLNYIIPKGILAIIFGILGGILTMYFAHITWNKDVFNSTLLYITSASIGTTLSVLIVSNSSWKINKKKYLKLRFNKNL